MGTRPARQIRFVYIGMTLIRAGGGFVKVFSSLSHTYLDVVLPSTASQDVCSNRDRDTST